VATASDVTAVVTHTILVGCGVKRLDDSLSL
jgi:hypothetical protein